ncbi:hypothetical protein RJG79_04455 [Mycoplasmatota bacterium WC44]
MKDAFLTCNNVMSILRVKKNTAYKIIRELNAELKNEGFVVQIGRVPAEYFRKRFGIR